MVQARGIEVDSSGRARFQLSTEFSEEVPVILPVRGRHMIQNALLAAAVGLKEGIAADEVAAALGLSAHRLEAALRLHGTTVPRELKRLRVDTARQALAESDAPVSEIARDLGYHDQSHFTRFFRSQVGETPSSFRSRSRASGSD